MNRVENLIKEINDTEKINCIKEVNIFEKKLLFCFSTYSDHSGLEDFKFNELDFIILYNIWKELNIRSCINEYLIIMYAYYKLEEFHFPIDLFNYTKETINIIIKTDIINIINNYICL